MTVPSERLLLWSLAFLVNAQWLMHIISTYPHCSFPKEFPAPSPVSHVLGDTSVGKRLKQCARVRAACTVVHC